MTDLNDYRFQIKMDVAWGDMDALGVVNNSVFFKYFETARIKYYEKLKVDSLDKDLNPTLAQTSCRYLSPLTYPNTLTIGVRVKSMGQSSIVFEHAIFSETGELCAIGDAVVVAVNTKTLKKEDVPETMRNAIAQLEGGDL